jgi:hypothetical protein
VITAPSANLSITVLHVTVKTVASLEFSRSSKEIDWKMYFLA